MGTLWTSGNNEVGSLGLGDTTDRQGFHRIPDLVSTQVACGYKHVVAIDNACQLWGWGANDSEQLSPLKCYYITSPTILRKDAQVVLTGFHSTVLLTTDDKVMVCGRNDDGQLATGSTSRKTEWTK